MFQTIMESEIGKTVLLGKSKGTSLKVKMHKLVHNLLTVFHMITVKQERKGIAICWLHCKRDDRGREREREREKGKSKVVPKHLSCAISCIYCLGYTY